MTYRQRQARRRGRRGRRRNPALLVVFVPLLILGAVLLSAIGYVIAIAADTPPLSELKPRDKGATSVVYAADGSRLGYVRSDEIRTPVPWSDMPACVRSISRIRSATSSARSARPSSRRSWRTNTRGAPARTGSCVSI